MGGAASAPSREVVQKRPVCESDIGLLNDILSACQQASTTYTARVQDAANFVVDYSTKAGGVEDQAEEAELAFANSKGDPDVGSNSSKDPDPAAGANSLTEAEAASNAQRAAQFADLMKWLHRNGAYLPGISLKEAGAAGFAVHCEKDMPATSSVLKVPFACLITDTVAAGTATGRALVELRDQLAALAHCQLSVYLLEDMERGSKSPFHPYYASLPRELPQHSLFWTSREKDWLKGTCFMDDVLSFEVMVQSDYEAIVSHISGFERFSFEEFLWSRIIVSSRNFSIRVNMTDHIAMVPLADMMNHHEPRRTAWDYRDEDRAFVITALDKFCAGSQITNSYGQKSASQLLLHYGFIPANFGCNRVELLENQITMDLSPSTTLPAEAPAATQRLGHDISKEPPVSGTSHTKGRGIDLVSMRHKQKAPQHVWLKKKILGDPHVFRLRINIAHRETGSCLRYVSIVSMDSKQHLTKIKRMEKTDTAALPVFFDLQHLARGCAIIAHLAQRRCLLLDTRARPPEAITSYNNLNAWRIAEIERAVASFFDALGKIINSIAELHEDLQPKLLVELQHRKNDLLCQWVYYLLSCCSPPWPPTSGRGAGARP